MKNGQTKERLNDIRLFRKDLPYGGLVYLYTIRNKLRPFYDAEEECSLFNAEELLNNLFSSGLCEGVYVSRDLCHFEAYEDLPLESRMAMFVLVREFLARVRVGIQDGAVDDDLRHLCFTQWCLEASPEKGFWLEFNKEIKIPHEVLLPIVLVQFRRWHRRCWAEFKSK